MDDNDYSRLAEITCKNWMENIQGSSNHANILFLALSLRKRNDELSNTYLSEFFDLPLVHHSIEIL